MITDNTNGVENIDEVFQKLKRYEGQILKVHIKSSKGYFVNSKGLFNLIEDRYYKLFHRCNFQEKNCSICSEIVGQGNYGIIKIETLQGLCIYNNFYICKSKISGKEMINLKFGEEGEKRYEKYLNQCNPERDKSFC